MHLCESCDTSVATVKVSLKSFKFIQNHSEVSLTDLYKSVRKSETGILLNIQID